MVVFCIRDLDFCVPVWMQMAYQIVIS